MAAEVQQQHSEFEFNEYRCCSYVFGEGARTSGELAVGPCRPLCHATCTCSRTLAECAQDGSGWLPVSSELRIHGRAERESFVLLRIELRMPRGASAAAVRPSRVLVLLASRWPCVCIYSPLGTSGRCPAPVCSIPTIQTAVPDVCSPSAMGRTVTSVQLKRRDPYTTRKRFRVNQVHLGLDHATCADLL